MAVWFIAPKVWEDSVHGDIRVFLDKKNIVYFEFERNIETREWDPKENLDSKYWDREDCVIARGPIQFINYLRKKYPRLNFATGFKDGFYCTQYLSEYPRDWFLNSDCIFTTFGLLKQKSSIDKEFFIRPNSPYKSFTGLTVTPENFWIEMNSLEKINHLPKDELILVANNKVIDSEFRYVICNKEVIGYSEYRWDGRLDIRRDTLPECLELSNKVASYEYQIDDIYVVDIGMIEGEAKIIEFNSFCSSGLYAIDLDPMIDKIEKYVKSNY